MKRLLFFVVLLGTATFATAQKGWEAGGWLGVSNYFGDLNTNYSLNMPNAAGGILARYNFNNRIGIKFSANYGKVEADDANSSNAYERARNLSFQSDIFEGTMQLDFNFLPYIHGSTDNFFTPYLFGGLTVLTFNPKAEYQGELVELRPLGTEGQFRGEEYYTTQAALAYGIGLKIDLSYYWSLNFELSARNLFTDYLDDVSTVYPDQRSLEKERGEIAVALSDRSIMLPDVDSSQLGLPGTQRGNSRNNDSYTFFQVGLVYYFGQLICPPPGNK